MPKKPLAKKGPPASSSSRKALSNKRLPAIENKHTRERGHGITYELRPVLCGKPGCQRHHGPYWYAFWTQGNKVRTVYIGKKFQKVEDKCPERLRPGGFAF